MYKNYRYRTSVKGKQENITGTEVNMTVQINK
jgi:hypothetical protein